MKKLLNFSFIIYILFFNTNCTEKIKYSGKLLEEENYDYRNYVNKKEIINNLGNPNYTDPIENKYYYFSEKNINKNFFSNKISNRILIVYNFNEDGIVINFAEFNLTDENKILIKDETTTHMLSKEGLLEKIFGGVGTNVGNKP